MASRRVRGHRQTSQLAHWSSWCVRGVDRREDRVVDAGREPLDAGSGWEWSGWIQDYAEKRKLCVTKQSDVSQRCGIHQVSISPLWRNKAGLYSRYYAEACNEWRDPSPLLSAWATQLRRNIAAVASRWRHCVRFDRPGNRTPNLTHWCANRPLITIHVLRSIQQHRALIHAIESVVIQWAHQIQEVVRQDSSAPILAGLHPWPHYELNFWKEKAKNLE